MTLHQRLADDEIAPDNRALDGIVTGLSANEITFGNIVQGPILPAHVFGAQQRAGGQVARRDQHRGLDG